MIFFGVQMVIGGLMGFLEPSLFSKAIRYQLLCRLLPLQALLQVAINKSSPSKILQRATQKYLI
jgi:hypothetical protein